MSIDSEKPHLENTPAPAENNPPPGANPQGQEPWQQIAQDLKGALDTWTHLSGKAQTKTCPEEQKLTEMRRLLADLKAKIRDFES